MRTNIDFAPLFRSSVGFDRMIDALEAAAQFNTGQNWPPYDIVKEAEDSYRITLAVAGFAPDELSITQERNVLTVASQKDGANASGYLHRGIPVDGFERRFDLADHVVVDGASLADGLLTITLRLELPDAMKPRRIEIASEPFPVRRRGRQSAKAPAAKALKQVAA
jgi:molecular chaperone IbpA